MRPFRWLLAPLAWLFGRRRSRSEPAPSEDGERIVPAGPPERAAENLVLVLLGIAVLFAVGFIVTYAEFGPIQMPNELLGVCLGGAFLFIALALAVVAKRLVVSEELEEAYPGQNEEEQEKVVEIVRQSGSRFTRKRLLLGAAGATGGALGLAALTPTLSLGPVWDTKPLDETPWHRGSRLVDESDNPIAASGIEIGSFYTAFPRAPTRTSWLPQSWWFDCMRADFSSRHSGRAGRRAGSSRTRRSAPTPPAPLPSTASPPSRWWSRTPRSSARVTTRPSTRPAVARSSTDQRDGHCPSCRS